MALNVKTSIVDYLKSIGQDSSYSNRAKLASQNGITNYTGSAAQNTALLKALQGTANTSQKAAADQTAKSKKKDQSMEVEAMDEPVSAAASSSLSGNGYNNGLDISSIYNQYLSSVGAAPTYTASGMADQILQQINNREAFNYDPNKDITYQQYKDLYTANGDKAMRDTMGNAAALTGGYGNSYAVTAGSQAYDAYMEGLNDKALELRQNALNEYNQETADLYNKYNAALSQEEMAYQQYLDQYNMWNNDRSLALDQANAYINQYNTDRAFDYGVYRDNVGDEQWQKTFDFNQAQADADNTYRNDYFTWQKEQAEKEYALDQAKIAASLAGKSSGSGGSKVASAPSITDVRKEVEELQDSMRYSEDWINNYITEEYADFLDTNSEYYDPSFASMIYSLLGGKESDTKSANSAAAAEAASKLPWLNVSDPWTARKYTEYLLSGGYLK